MTKDVEDAWLRNYLTKEQNARVCHYTWFSFLPHLLCVLRGGQAGSLSWFNMLAVGQLQPPSRCLDYRKHRQHLKTAVVMNIKNVVEVGHCSSNTAGEAVYVNAHFPPLSF